MSRPPLLASPSWTAGGDTFARGEAFDESGVLLRANELARRFAALPSAAAWPALAATLNGKFAVVRVDGAKVFAVVDRLRSIPLFHARLATGTCIADTASALLPLLGDARLDPVSTAEFRLTGYTTGSNTLYAGLHQLPAGHALVDDADGTGAAQVSYYAYRHRDFFTDSREQLIDRLADVHARVFRRLVDDVAGRPIVLPLSGGYDSRLIGVALRDLGCKDVLCYTYGTEGNWEARISRELAHHLGFRWTMVRYSPADWRTWRELPEFRRFFRESANASSSPHFQDWPAVRELVARGEIADDAIFVPGHTGDFLTGGHIPKAFLAPGRFSREAIVDAIFAGHYKLWAWPRDPDGALREAFAARVESVTGPITGGPGEHAADVFEAWECAERQAKFIVNSVRVYEAFGRAWRLPLFDSELMDFWARVPLRMRAGRALFRAFVEARQALPVTQANTDRAAPVAAALHVVERVGLKPLAARARQRVRRWRWRREYAGGTIGWFAVVDEETFRRRYTGSEIGHAFFAERYLEMLDTAATQGAAGGASFEARWRERFESFARGSEDDAGIAGWSPGGLRARLNFFVRRFANVSATGRWLDAGCGAGTYARWLADRGLEVVGLDYSRPTLDKARARLPGAVALCVGDATRLPFADAAFDGVICFGVLQAVAESASVVDELARVLRPGGQLWIDALNRQALPARVTEARRRVRHQGRHLRYESAAELRSVLVAAGLDSVQLHWLPLAPRSLQWLQPALQSRAVTVFLANVPIAGKLIAHSIMFSARKAGALR